MKKNYGFKAVQAGFTLIELMVTVVIIGTLITIFVMSTSGSDTAAKAAAVVKASDDISSTFSRVASSCGISTSVNGSPIPASGKTVLDVIFDGEVSVATGYQGCWRQSSSRPLGDIAQRNGTGYRIQGFEVQMAGGGSAPYELSYSSVPDELVLRVAQRYSGDVETLAASDTTSAKVRYSAASAGARTMTLLVYP